MDPSSVHNTPPVEEDDEWDTDGFVIPNLGIEGTDQTKVASPEVEIQEPPPKAKEETTIYLGPHGAPPSQSKQQYSNPANRKQRLKQKLKEADRRTTMGRENKLENLRELVGGGRSSSMNMAKGSSRDWLDPHCHEAEFQK